MLFRKRKDNLSGEDTLYYDEEDAFSSDFPEDGDDREPGGGPSGLYGETDGFSYAADSSIRARADFLRQADKERRQRERREQREWKREAGRRRRAHFVQRHRRGLVRLTVFLSILAALSCVLLYLAVSHQVTSVEVEGNTMLTDEQITDIVCAGPLGRNSLYLAYRYRDAGVRNVPFVEKMTVSIVSPHEIRVMVYEKALAGCVVYLGSYMYFTRDGTVVESSRERVEGIPEVTGLSFDHILLEEKLPVADASVFDRILKITQLLDKYSLNIDRIYFDSMNALTLFYGNVRINMGQDSYTDEKISNLAQILPRLEGRTGVIDLTGFVPGDNSRISFMEKSAPEKTD